LDVQTSTILNMLTTLKWIKKLFIAFVVILFLILLLSRGHIFKKDELEYGLTFSKKQAQNLGLDWQKVYLDILDDFTSGIWHSPH